MDLRFTPDQEQFRADARTWLEDRLDGPFAKVRGRGGPGDEHELFDERWEWEQELGRDGWIGLGWPSEFGGRGVTLVEQMIFFEEYARAGGPGRVGIVGEGLLGPTIVHFGRDDQKHRFLPGILRGTEVWCQGYSEPNAGSDLANVQTRAVREGDEWIVHGQKVWTSLAHWAQWIFVLCRTDREAPKHKGLSYLLMPMAQAGIDIRPIVQITGHSEFNETFFDGARTAAENVVGEVNGGWRVATGTLASSVARRRRTAVELRERATRDHRTPPRQRCSDRPGRRQRLAEAWIDVASHAVPRVAHVADDGDRNDEPRDGDPQVVLGELPPRAGELAIDVLGPSESGRCRRRRRPPPPPVPRPRADTIYGGSNEIQKNIIGEQALGLPREPR